MIDTHCHVSFRQFDADQGEVLARARAAGVTTIVNPGTDREESAQAVRLAEAEPDIVFAAVGTHPQDIASFQGGDLAVYRAWCAHPRVVAVGEVGLERSAQAPSLDRQAEVLDTFVRLALAAGKPVIFHVRDAHDAFREFLARAPRDLRGVVHCFSGTQDDARAYVARGLLVSVTGIVTFPNAAELRAVVRDLSLDHLLLETDAPFLAPQAYRGKRNEPAYVTAVAQEVARVHGVPVADVERVTDENARRLFGLPRGTG